MIALGTKWMIDYNKGAKDVASIKQLSASMGGSPMIAREIKKLDTLKNQSYLLIGLGVVCLIASVMVFKLGKISGLIMLATLGFMISQDKMFLIPCVPFVFGGLFALLSKNKPQVA